MTKFNLQYGFEKLKPEAWIASLLVVYLVM